MKTLLIAGAAFAVGWYFGADRKRIEIQRYLAGKGYFDAMPATASGSKP